MIYPDQARVKVAKAALELAQAELDATRTRPHVAVKREASPILVPSSSSGKKKRRLVIDLTDD